MSGIEAANNVGSIAELASALAERIKAQVAEAMAQIEGLKRVGGLRDDHAAAILCKSLRVPCLDMKYAFSRVVEQLDELKANPFGQD